jgi:hypothetical protein
VGREALAVRIGASVAKVTFVDARTEELRAAHDVLSEFYAERLAGALDRMPEERALLGPFRELVLGADIGADVGDIGCGTVFWGGIPPEKEEASAQGYLIARKAS